MKFLFVTDESLSADLAWQLKKEGHEVKMFCHSQGEKDVGLGFFEKVDEWEPLKDWADVIIFDDIGFGQKADQLRSEGKPVVGGSVYTDKLELDREFGQSELNHEGVEILPSWNFTSFDAAIDFVKANPDRYVLKPSGKAQNEKELLFIGQEPDGKDVLQVLEHYKANWSKKIKEFLIQKYAEGVEIAVGAFFNGKDFVLPLCVNFEHKRLFPHELGPSTGEMGCYDDRTEVLTDKGWKVFKDIIPTDRICTLHPETHAIEYQRPVALVAFKSHRRLVQISSRTLDIAVTPDHNMYVRSQGGVCREPSAFGFVKARDLESGSVVKRTGSWIGVERATFIIPPALIGRPGEQLLLALQTKELEIPMDAWLAFFGLWLACGSTSQTGTSQLVEIAPGSCAGSDRIRRLLATLPFDFRERQGQFACSDEQLCSYLKTFGGAPEKRLDGFIRSLAPRQIGILLDWFALGDATTTGDGLRVFRAYSPTLADDLQELLLKTGSVGIIERRAIRVDGRSDADPTDKPGIQYDVIEHLSELDSRIGKGDVKVVPYNGTVYCATVPNHIMYVRRNGKPCWCGNTSMYWSKTSPVFDRTLFKMKAKLAESKYVGYIDINCIANGRGIWPLEFTTRFGYPTISIQMEGVLSDWGTFLSDIAQGKEAQLKAKKGYQVGVVVTIPPWPFQDDKAFRKYSEGATILFRRQSLDGVHIGEVKLEEGDWHIAGNSGYALVITGSGATMSDAIDNAYQSVRNVMIPNMFYRDDIGRRWTHDSDKLLSWGYI